MTTQLLEFILPADNKEGVQQILEEKKFTGSAKEKVYL